MKKCINLVLNPFTHDSRVLKESKTLSKMGLDVEVFALHENDLPKEGEQDGFKVRRFPLVSKKWSKNKAVQLFKYAEAWGRMVSKGVKDRPDLVVANDLTALPIGWAIKILTGAKLIYDSHELWRDSDSRSWFPKPLFVLSHEMEKQLSRRSDAVLTVSDEISKDMSKTLGIRKPQVIRNIPEKSESRGSKNNIRAKLGLSDDKVIVLHQGAIGIPRGGDLLIEAFKLIDKKAVLAILGGKSFHSEAKELAKKHGVSDRVFFLDSVTPEELIAFSSTADIGISAIRGTCLSHHYCLPNKFFEYIQSGLAVITPDLPELGRWVREFEIGDTFKDQDYQSLAEKINRLVQNPELLKRCQEASRKHAQVLTWENEEKSLMKVVEQLIGQEVEKPTNSKELSH